MSWGIRYAVAAVLLLACVLSAPGGEAASRAAQLMKKRMYRDAAKVLESAVARQGDPNSSLELRLLGECYYLQREYAKARPFYNRALTHQTTEKGKTMCQARLAIIAYRLQDTRGALERIETFLRQHPTDSQAGTLYVVRIKLNSAANKPLAEKLRLVEADYKAISKNRKAFGYYNGVLAAQALGDLHVKAGNEDKAIALYVTAVHEMRGLVTEFKNAGRSIPRDLMQGVDSMSLQVANYYLERKNWNEGRKWLENVDYVDSLKWQAKLLLAQIRYQEGQYSWVPEILKEEFLRTVPEGKTKSNMYLLLGYSYLKMFGGDRERAKEVLKKVGNDSAGYAQAQHGLGDIYREQQDPVNAEKHYRVSVKDPSYAAPAHFYLAQIYKKRAETVPGLDEKAKTQRRELFESAGAHLQTLITKYPLTSLAKDAKPMLDELRERGIQITIASSDRDKIAEWRKTIQDSPGSNAAAQALISMADHFSKAAADASGKKIARAPNWDEVARACKPILASQAPFTGVTEERWRQRQARAAYLMGRAELGSLPLGPSALRLGDARPTPIEGGGNAERAAAQFQQAMKLTPKAQKEFWKDLDLSLLEAMFKSDNKLTRDDAEKKYAEKEQQYGTDPQYQRLILVLADWLSGQERYEMAARIYRKVSRRANFNRDEVMHLLYLAGINYSRAGRKAATSDTQQANLAFYIYPKQLIQTASLIKTHPPCQKSRTIFWKKTGPDITGEEALRRVSEAFRVPFVWSPSDHPGGVDDYLKKKKIPRATLVTWRESMTLEQYLGQILDLDRYKLDFDLGASGGKPTLNPKDEDTFETVDESQVIEIYDPTREQFPKLACSYGGWGKVHRNQAMLFHIIERVEAQTGAKVFWAEGVDKEEALAHEYRSGPAGTRDVCTGVLGWALEPLGLSYKVIARDRSGELIRESNEAFNDLRKFGQDTRYAEEALYNMAVNFYYLKDRTKMKLVLREYLKMFDGPNYKHYYDACFWLGWAFEKDHKFRESVKYYSMAAEESVILYKLKADEKAPSPGDIRSRLSYDTLFNLSLKAAGQFKEYKLAADFIPFIRFNTNVEIKLDPTAETLDTLINRSGFVDKPCIELIHEVMASLGLGLRTENGDKEVAPKAYLRLATVYKAEELLSEALEYLNTLATRFPKEAKKVEALKLRLDIFRGLKDYGEVLSTLEALREAAGASADAYKLDYESGRVYFDMCDYPRAIDFYSRALSGAEGQDDWMAIREGLAYSYLRQTNTLAKALTEYKSLMRYEASPLRHTIYTMMAYYLEGALSPGTRGKPLPDKEGEFIKGYEEMSDEQRSRLGQNDLAQATWIYYALGLQDRDGGNKEEALKKFEAAGVSPDTFLAGESLVRAAEIQMEKTDFWGAKETLQHMLFTTKAVEPTVRATYYLGKCNEALGRPEEAMKRYNEVLQRYPVSPYAEKVKQDPFYIDQTQPPETEAPEAEAPAETAGAAAE